jgi:hypothetical protein
MFGWLEWWWLGVFIASTTVPAVAVVGTPDSPVSATSADRWGLELLTVEVFCLLAAPDSPVRPVIADCLLTSGTADCA